MPIRSGSRLGPYEIVAPIGAGGMGEVWRARDPRLGREVAIKVLPASFSADADRLRRFEQEARAAGILNHPNITAVLDIGEHDGAPYVVQELLEGETLRDVLADGKLPAHKAIDYAIQIAHGLAAAHEKGIVHRDLKPTNLFVTRDDRIKVLDFGLAKLIDRTDEKPTFADSTRTASTEIGVILGTLGYMSPEQVRGQAADARSDIFSFGAVLYEMLMGVRAFRGDSEADVMTAILREEPDGLAARNPNLSSEVVRVVGHCLEKSAERRFQSARDLAFDLEGLSFASGEPPALKTLRSREVSTAGRPAYRRLTFRRGTIVVARFAPDTHTIVSCVRWEGAPLETYTIRRESPESRPLGLSEARLLAVSSTGDLAVVVRAERTARGGRSGGILARMPLGGGAPRELLENVKWADWSPDGSALAVVRQIGDRERLDFPIGNPVYEPPGWIGFPRVSPHGDSVAFINYSGIGGSTGSIAVVDRRGRVERLSEESNNVQGLAWAPGGDEVWFTSSHLGSARALRAITLQRRERLVEQVPGDLHLHDVSPSGSVLLAHEVSRYGILCRVEGQPAERELSWFDYSVGPSLSDDGNTILFAEGGEGGGPLASSYLRGTDGSAAIRLGEGAALALSPDGRWALSQPVSRERLLLLPTGPGEPRELIHKGLTHHEVAAWSPNGKRILFAANEAGRHLRSYVQNIDGSEARPVTPEGTIAYAISPDGGSVAGGDLVPKLYSIDGGDPAPIPGVQSGDIPIRWHEDGHSLFVRAGYLPARVFRVDTTTGARELFLELMPSDPSGVAFIGSITLTPDAASYAYGYTWMRSDLYVVEGLA
ncbi:MAG: protein kinase [Acidobacteriota bacterium]|nr:protein kinase [Acidobacteriota bacterium]